MSYGYNSQPSTPPPTRKKKKNMTPYLIVGGMLAMGVFMLLVVLGLMLVFASAEDRIASGVSVAGLDLGGEVVSEAEQALQVNFANRTITVTDGDRRWDVPLANLGISIDFDSTLERVQDAYPNTDLQPAYNIDLNRTMEGLFALSEQVNIDAIGGDIPQFGRAIDVPVVLDRLRVDVTGELADGVLDLNMFDIQPPEPEVVEEQTPTPTVDYNGPTTTHVVEAGQELGLIAQLYGVYTEDIVAMNGISDPNLIYVGQELTIPAAGFYTPTAADAPPAPTNNGRSLVVSVSSQRIYAYENGQFVHSHLVSTGLPDTPTVLGDYAIYVKFVADDMQGADYFLPQVPYVMYFYQGYGIHGTYWHNAFGRPMSHGCVNLPVEQAEWFFNFASVGTPVRVIA